MARCLRATRNNAGGPYFMATYQLDWRHLMVKIRQTFSGQPKLVSELLDYLYSSQAEEKNIDIVIDRRFKRHGQSWTTD